VGSDRGGMAARIIVGQRSPQTPNSTPNHHERRSSWSHHERRRHLDDDDKKSDLEVEDVMNSSQGSDGAKRRRTPELARADTHHDMGVLEDATGVVNMRMLLEAKGLGTTPSVRPPPIRTLPVEKWVFSQESAVRTTVESNKVEMDVNSIASFTSRSMDAGSRMSDLLDGRSGRFSEIPGTPVPPNHPDEPQPPPPLPGVAEAEQAVGEVTWYHCHGRDISMLTSLCETLGALPSDVEVANEGKGENGIEVSFRRGSCRERDYLFIVFQETLLKNTVSAIRHDNVVPPSPGSGGDVPVKGKRLIDPSKGDHRKKKKKQEQATARKRRDSIWAASKQTELEASQVTFFFFPDKQVIVSTGLSSPESPALIAARENIENLRSAVRNDCSKGDGAATLLVVLLDGVMDAIFPVLDLYGDALEGMTNLMANDPAENLVRLSTRLKTRLNQIRRFNWDARGVFLQMHQDMYGVLNGSLRVQTLIDSTLQVEKETDAYMVKCVGIQQMFSDFQQQKINSTLNALTNLTFALMPFSALTGLWGMNFDNMPELSLEWGYQMFWCIAVVIQVRERE